MIFFTFLFLVAILSSNVLVEACSCFPPDPEQMYCSSGFVLKVKILNETRTLDLPAGVPGNMPDSFLENFAKYWYDISIEEEYRVDEYYSNATKTLVSFPSNLCGYRYNVNHTYIIMGQYAEYQNSNYLGSSLCSVNVDVDDTGDFSTEVTLLVESDVQC